MGNGPFVASMLGGPFLFFAGLVVLLKGTKYSDMHISYIVGSWLIACPGVLLFVYGLMFWWPNG
jgi:hypothetical protein